MKENFPSHLSPENLPISRGEIFNPAEALKEVMRSKGKERREKYAEFKEKLAFQTEGMTDVSLRVEELIRENPDTPFDELLQKTKELGIEYGMNPEQERYSHRILLRYETKRKEMKELREKFPSDERLFEELFQFRPKGKIEFLTDPANFYIKCFEEEDYLKAYFSGRFRVSEQEKESARKTGGSALSLPSKPSLGVVTLENSSAISGDLPEIVRVHEGQHSINRIYKINKGFDSAKKVTERLYQATGDEEHELALLGYLREDRKIAEESARDEILAHYKDGESPGGIRIALLGMENEAPLYDFVSDSKTKIAKWLEGDEPANLVSQSVERVFGAEYKELLEQSILALERLEKAGYSRDKIVNLFVREPLPKWKRTAEMLIERIQRL